MFRQIFFGLLLFAPLVMAEEAAQKDSVPLLQWVKTLNKLKSSCYHEWGAWRNVNGERLAAFQAAALASPALSTDRDIQHNMIAIVNSFVASQAAFEKTVAEYDRMQTRNLVVDSNWKRSPEEYRALQLELIKRRWILAQENSSTPLQIRINALQRMASFNQTIMISGTDPVLSAAALLEKGNEESKKRAEFLSLSTEIHLELLSIRPDGVIAKVLDEHAIKSNSPLDDGHSPSAHRYSAHTIFITDIPEPVKGARLICKAASNGSYRESPDSSVVMEKWIALETRELNGK
ncbi:MAG: hypothetical protein ABI615_11700 [Chthoniobacterales bacterium]